VTSSCGSLCSACLYRRVSHRELGFEVLRKRAGASTTDEMFDMFKGNRYKNGFLYKTMAATGLITDGVMPSLDETERFAAKLRVAHDDDEDPEAEAASERERVKAEALGACTHHSTCLLSRAVCHRLIL